MMNALYLKTRRDDGNFTRSVYAGGVLRYSLFFLTFLITALATGVGETIKIFGCLYALSAAV
jgi:hypothetical protein